MMNLFYLSGNMTGGWITYTAHLVYGLIANGAKWELFKVGKNTEHKSRNFGYGIQYRNLRIDTAIAQCKQGPTVILALQKNYREQAAKLIEAGAWLVVHDPAEFANLKLGAERCVTIRKAVKSHLPTSHLILHPYARKYGAGTLSTGEQRACSICRIDFDKNTHILLEANRALPKGMQIEIRGFENRLYTRFKLCPKFPEWVQSVNSYARERCTAVEICHKSYYTCDMSLIKGDGGGTQYSFLEAMDAGSVNIVHKGWIRANDEMVSWPNAQANCIAVGNSEQLAQVLRSNELIRHRKALVNNSDALLKRHCAKVISKQFSDILCKG